MKNFRLALYAMAAGVNFVAAGMAHSWLNLIIALLMCWCCYMVYIESW